jgi:hypothetical protein
MITVKAKKQTELASKRRHRASDSRTTNGERRPSTVPEDPSTESRPPSPADSNTFTPRASPSPQLIRPAEPFGPSPRQFSRTYSAPLMPTHVANPNPADIADIFVAQTRRISLFFASDSNRRICNSFSRNANDYSSTRESNIRVTK